MKRKHVFLFDEGSRAALYGIGTYIRQMVLCLTSIEEMSLHLVRLNSDVEKVELSHKESYDEFSIPRSLLSVGGKPIRYYRNAWRLVRLYLSVEADKPVYFLLNYTSHHVLIPEIRAALPLCRIYFTIHYQDWCFALNGNVFRFRKIIQVQDPNTLDLNGKEVYESYQKEKETYEQVDKVVCLSHFTEQLLWNEYQISKDKTTVIYNGLKDESGCCPKEIKLCLKGQFGFQPEEKVILFVGRLDSVKGVRLLIRSFLSVLEKRQDCRLILVGDGDFSRCLKECDGYWNKITFTGWLEKERLYQFYRIADVGVLPSMHEQCSYTGIEMMMFGIPLIASSTTGLKEMIRGASGFVFDTVSEEDHDAIYLLADLLEHVLSEVPDKIENRRLSAHMNYKEYYSLDRMKGRLLRLLKD